MFKKKFTTLTLLAGLLAVPILYTGAGAGMAAATTYKASTYGLEETVESEDRQALKDAFDQINDREFTKARYQFQKLIRSNSSVKPFWESAMYLARAHADLCEAWWLETIEQGFDHTLSQAELQYLMPLNRQAECIGSVAQKLLKSKSPTPSQVDWFWQQLPEVARYFSPASVALAEAYRRGFGTDPDLEKAAQWYLAALRDEETLGSVAQSDARSGSAKILLTFAEEQQTVDPSMAKDLYGQSYAYSARANWGSPDPYLFKNADMENPLTKQDEERILAQVQACENKSITQCAFYTLPVNLDLKPPLPRYLPSDRVIQWLLENQNEKAFEAAKSQARVNLPTAWASQLYTALLTEQYDEALFRLSYLAFQADGLENDLIAAIAAQIDSPQRAKQVIMHAAAAVLSNNAVDAATAAYATDYLDRYVNEASPQAMFYLSQVFSRPLTPAYDIDKAIHLATRAFKQQPELATSLQVQRLLSMKSQAEWQEARDAWRIIAFGLSVGNVAGATKAFDEESAAQASRQWALECQTAGFKACDLIDATEAIYDQAWPATKALVSTDSNITDITQALQSALAQYVALNNPQRIDALDQLMRRYASPVFVSPIASDMQRKGTPSRMAMRYTLLAGALGKGGHWIETLTQQGADLHAMYQTPTPGIHFLVGDAYWAAGEDIMQGFPVQNKSLVKLFYENAVLSGDARDAQRLADILRQGKGLAVDNHRALELYEFALQQQRRLVVRDLPAYLTAMTDINEHDTKAYAYALMAYQASFGPFLSEEDLENYGKSLSAVQKAQAQEWADQCLGNDFYLCDIYEPNNTLLYMPVKP